MKVNSEMTLMIMNVAVGFFVMVVSGFVIFGIVQMFLYLYSAL